MTCSSVLFVIAFTAAVAAAQPPAPVAPAPAPQAVAPQTAAPQTAAPQTPVPQASAPPALQQPDVNAQDPIPPLQVTDENRAMMLMLLDRIQQVTADQMNADSKSGKLTVDRAKLDEILANVSQIKTMLQK